MPLTKLFQRRDSSQKDKKKSLTSAELSASDSIAKDLNTEKEAPVQSEMNSDNCSSEGIRESSAVSEKKSSNTEPDFDDLYEKIADATVPSEESRRSSVPAECVLTEQVRSKSRSLSLKESGTKINVQRFRRRKCESESAASSLTDDEGFEEKIIQLRERDLEKVINQYVDRLIRESIITAVNSVNVDNLYEDVIKSISRSSSESSESSGSQETVEQKLHTDSITEYADLQMLHTFEEEKLEDEELDEPDNSNQQREHEATLEVSDQLQPNIQNRSDNKDSTEVGEDLSCPQSDSTPTNKITDSKVSEPDNDSNPVIQVKTNVNDSMKSIENSEFSTSLNQNENTLVKVLVGGSNQLDASAESDIINIKDFHANAVHQGTEDVRECQKNNLPEILNETVKDIVNCPGPETDHVCQTESTDFKDELADETDNCKMEMKDLITEDHHADVEESTSLNSMASEDSKIYVRTTSDDGILSSEEDNLVEPDAALNKDSDDLPKPQHGDVGKNLNAEADLMAMSGDDFSHLLTTAEEPDTPASDLGENLPEQKPTEEEKKVNWKVGYLHVKLPHKSRHKKLKVWKKRCVAIQADEFAGDDSDPCLVLSVYSGDSSAAKKHSASFWKSISCQKAVIYRSSSRTHPYAFTISDDKKAVIHLATDSEAIAQEWMAAIRAILWPPSPVVQLEKMLNGREFEISIIDNDFSYHAGLLGMYGYLTITSKKLILVHPQQGFVIQEWYLNTIDKFQLIPQTRIEDLNKVLSMTTCSDSSTGKGDLLIFCKEAVSLLQAVASTIHHILTHHSKQEGGKYQKELEEIGEWLVADASAPENYYKVPPRQVKSLLDIPNFIFNKPLTPNVAAESQKPILEVSKVNNPTRASQDSGISSESAPDDFLNCSVTSFKAGGGGHFPGKSSDSELSDAYTPPRSPEVKTRRELNTSVKKADA